MLDPKAASEFLERILPQQILPGRRLPDQIFRGERVSAFFDSDLLFQKSFYEGFVQFLRNIEGGAFLAQLVPNPKNYVFSNFGTYPCFFISGDSSAIDCVKLLEQDPGGSPADAIAYNAEVVVIASSDKSWAICSDRNIELAVASFTDAATEASFFESIPNIKKYSASAVKSLLEPVYCNDSGGVPGDLLRCLLENYS